MAARKAVTKKAVTKKAATKKAATRKSATKKPKPQQEYTVSCDGAVVTETGALITLVVYSNGEAFNSHVQWIENVASPDPTQDELLDTSVWLTDVWCTPSGGLYVCDADGRVHAYDGKAWAKAKVSPDGLTCILGTAGGDVFAAGDAGIVHRRTAKGKWESFGPALGGTIFDLAIAGDDLYAVGDEGLAWRKSGDTWTKIELPTSERLLAVCATSRGDILIGGSNGALFRGKGTSWKALPHEGLDIHSACEFGGKIYVAAGGSGVFVLEGDRLVNVKNNFTSYGLGSNPKYLSSSGGTLGVRFDGTDWFATSYS